MRRHYCHYCAKFSPQRCYDDYYTTVHYSTFRRNITSPSRIDRSIDRSISLRTGSNNTYVFPFFPPLESRFLSVPLNKEFHGCKMKRRLIIDRVSRRKLCHPFVPRSQQAKRKREIYQLRRTTFRRLKSTNRDARRLPLRPRLYLVDTWLELGGPISLNRRYSFLVTVPRPFTTRPFLLGQTFV